MPFNTLFAVDRFPVGLVLASNVSHIQATFRCALDSATPFRIRGGGHSYSGFSAPANGSLLLDISGLNRTLSVDTTRGLVRIQAGMCLGALYDTLWQVLHRVAGGLLFLMGLTCRSTAG